jgi:hypothetical protein
MISIHRRVINAIRRKTAKWLHSRFIIFSEKCFVVMMITVEIYIFLISIFILNHFHRIVCSGSSTIDVYFWRTGFEPGQEHWLNWQTFLSLSQPFEANAGIVNRVGHDLLFPNVFSSSLIYYSIIWRCTVWIVIASKDNSWKQNATSIYSTSYSSKYKGNVVIFRLWSVVFAFWFDFHR